jgi:hypothetical protein
LRNEAEKISTKEYELSTYEIKKHYLLSSVEIADCAPFIAVDGGAMSEIRTLAQGQSS